MNFENKRLTPMMKQFVELKKEYKDCILLFRAGDFYETFFDDAKVSSKVLSITLTKRGDIPMAGVPYHSITPYIKKLIQNNFKVALCEQLEDPKFAKGLVKRGVTKVITAGTILEDEFFSCDENNFIMCIYVPKSILEKFGVCLVDISTGEFYLTQTLNFLDVKTLIKKYSPNEIILNDSNFVKGFKSYIKNLNIYYNFLSDIRFNFLYAEQILKKQFGLNSSELGFDQKKFGVISAGALLFYIYKLQKFNLNHINKIKSLDFNSNMILDAISLRNLEITQTCFSNKSNLNNTLLKILNNTKTSFGFRLLKKHLLNPKLNVKSINYRLDAIDELNQAILERDKLQDLLDEFYDIQRITARIANKICSPKDLESLKISLEKLPKIKEILKVFKSKRLVEIRKIQDFNEVVKLIENSIVDNAPANLRDSGYIKKTFNKELSDLFNLAYDSQNFLKEFEEEQRLLTKIPTLRIKFNRVFGYFIEIPKSQESKVPNNYVITQTLANSLRFTLPALKEKENLILNAQEKMKFLENKIFFEIVDKLKIYVKNFQAVSKKIGLLDVFCSHSYCSQIYNYVRPSFNVEKKVEIVEGRNPIVEQFTNYISNDNFFDENLTFKIITGPNMAGKSCFLRQNALISIMAQCGCFVPAKSCNLRIYDRIFTRIGAYDDISDGKSTFMVEMSETANILNNATENSLILLDEIGRGTSTYDGLAIAWAITEEIVKRGSNCIFATHYHQLNKLSSFYSRIRNFHVVVKEQKDKIEFVREIREGGTDKSYGIYVGKLAGICDDVLDRARQIQKNIEDKEDIVIKEDFEQSLNFNEKNILKNKKDFENKNNLDKFI